MDFSGRFAAHDSRIAALLALASLRPDDATGPAVILTTAPELWATSQNETVLDLSVLMGMEGSAEKRTEGTVAPESATDLDARSRAIAPTAIVIDHTVLLSRVINQWRGNTADRDGWIPSLVALLPAGLFPDAEQVDALTVLCAWAATLPSVRALSGALPKGLLRHEKLAAWREHMQGHLPLCATIDLPGKIFDRIRWLEFTMAYFGAGRKAVLVDSFGTPDELDHFQEQPWFQRLSAWLLAGEPAPPYMHTAADVFSWPSEREAEEIITRLSRLAPLEHMGALCDVENGLRLPYEDGHDDGDWLLISGSVLSDGYIDFEHAHTKSFEKEPPARVQLQAGDIVIPRSLTATSTALVNTRVVKASLTDSAIRIHVTDPRITPAYLAEYLNSSAARALMLARAGRDTYFGTARISAAILKALPVPLLDTSLFGELGQIEETEKALHRLANELKERRRNLFDAQSAAEFDRDIHDLRRRGALYERGIERADSIAYQISNFYPFPIAYGYRLLVGLHDETMLYREQLRVAENLLAFLGSLALALVPPSGGRWPGPTPDLRKTWQGGVSPGHWRDAVVHACKAMGEQEKYSLAGFVGGLNIGSGKGFGRDIQELIGAKNDFKHDRGPVSPEECGREAPRLQALLDASMKALAFLTDYPLVQLQDFDQTRHAGWKMTFARYIGDHPGVETRTETFADKPMDLPIKGELYVTLRKDMWRSLYPFITVHTCEHCQAQESYFIDRWDERRGTAVLKSFERGHTRESREIGAELLRLQPEPAPAATS